MVALRAGASASVFVSFVGDDEIGSKVLKSLNECGLDTKYVKVVNGYKTEINEQYLDEVTKDYTLKRGPSELSQNYSFEMVDEYKQDIKLSDIVILVSKQPKDFLCKVMDFSYENKKMIAYNNISQKIRYRRYK